MRKEDISDALSGVDADIIEEAAARRSASAGNAPAADGQAPAAPVPVKKKPARMIAGIVSGAALIAAAVAGVIFLPKLIGQNNVVTSDPDITTTTAAATISEQPGVTGVTGTAPDMPMPEQGSVKRYLAGNSIVSAAEKISDDETQSRGILKLKLSTSKDIDESELREHIRLTDINAFTLEKQSAGSFVLRSEKPVESGVVVKFLALDNEGNVCDSWAFETEQEFVIDKVYPADGEQYVNPETGIEITFTEAIAENGIDKFISVAPNVSGKVETRGKTLYFIPTEGMKYEQIYTVSVKKGLKSALGKELVEDYTFSFSTGSVNDGASFYTQSSSSGFSESFIPDDKACVQIELSWELLENFPTFETHLYSFAGADAYYAAVKARADAGRFDDAKTDVSGLTEVFSSKEQPFTREGSTESYILLPDDLAQGYYVADITLAGSRESLQYLLEVSPLSVYAMSLGEENIFFVNSTETGKPAEGASVTLEVSGKKYSGKVGSDGTVKINTAGEGGRSVLSIENGSSRYIDCIVLSGTEDMKYEDLYYSYIYTDRSAYLPTDTIHVWGAVIPRSYNTPLPDGVAVRLSESEITDVVLAADGTFSTEIKLKDHGSAWRLSLLCDEYVLKDTYISIREYEKPTYVLDMETPDYVLFPQETPVPITLKASFYEGTPAEGIKLKDGSKYDSDEYLTTGKDGTVKTEVLSGSDSSDWHLSSASFYYMITGIENTYGYVYKSIPAFYRDVMLQYDYDKDNRTLKLNAYKMDLSKTEEFLKYRKGKDYEYWYSGPGDDSYEILKGAACDAKVDVSITHHWSERTEVDSYYDYIEKKNVPIYNYEYKEAFVGSYRVSTGANGAILENLPIDDTNGYYQVTIKYKDSSYRDVKMELTLYAPGYKENSDLYYYRIQAGAKMFMLDSESENDYTAWYGGTVYFTEGENKNFKLVCSDPDTSVNGQLLLAIYKSDFVSCSVKSVDDNTIVTIDGTRDLIPDAKYAGAYFDGKHVYRLVTGVLEFDPDERNITLEASSDEDKYDAGDTVKITVKATDKDGKALSNAVVHMSIVDEAAFAIEDQYVNILKGIYAYIDYPEVTQYISYIQHASDEMNDGAKGGGGSDSVRRDFRDTAFFESAVTDNNGNAVFTIEMPDNLTTWRVTMLALYDDGSERLYAGTAKMPIVTTRSLFITPIMQKEFVEGDDIAVSANCAGLESGGKISVKLTGNGVEQTKSISPKETANFGKLEKGSYTVTFRASNSGGSDAVEMPITVTDTLLETYIVKGAEINELSGIEPTKYPIRLSFFDKEYMFCTEILYDLMCYYGDSLDMRMASAFAEMELGYITEEDLVRAFIGETSEGFAKQLPAAAQDNEITALICAALPEAVSRYAVKDAFYAELAGNASMTDICMDYMALAALGEPVLGELNALYNSGKVETAESGIYLSAAFALSGDYRGAYEVYMKYVPEIKTEKDADGKIKAWIDADGGQKLTAAALITASVIDLPEAECFARYLTSDATKYDLYALQLVVYLRNYVPSVQGDAVVSYMLNGAKQTVKLNRHFPTTIVMTEKQFRNAGFEVTSGSVYTLVRYIGKISENSKTPTLSVTKQITGSSTAGSEMTVTIHAAPYSLVYDVIPCCGRFAKSVNGWCSNEGQLVRIYTDKDGNASYMFSANVSGNYVVESAVTYDYTKGEWGKCERSNITIKS